MENTNVVETEETPRMTKIETEHLLKVTAAYDSATDADKAKAKEIAETTKPIVATLNAAIAAIIVTEHNAKNRSLTISKAIDYAGAIDRGEWKLNHQGIAFYPNGKLADGQHRMNGLAISQSGRDIQVMVVPNFDKDAIDTIDRSKGRTAGEALEMMGVENGKEKASVAKTVMEYEFELANGKRPRFTDPQVESWVQSNDDLLNESFLIAGNSAKNVSEPALNASESKTIAMLMLRGGWGKQQVVGYLASIQQGVATYPESPTVILSRMFVKAKLSAKKTDNLTRKQKLALAMKGLHLWNDEKSVARLTWKAGKEELPTNAVIVNTAEDRFVA
jgi:hypothetical protein